MKVLRYALIALLCAGIQPAFGAARVAVLHLAPFAPAIEDTAVDIAINGETTFTGVLYKDFVDYVELDAGDYMIEVFPAGTQTAVMSGMFSLEDDTDYSVFAVGNGSTQDLELLALQDANAMAPPATVHVRVVHAAPFAAAPADTEVSIRTAGGDVVNGLVGVPYGVTSGFFELPAGEYDLKVASNDGSVNFIDPLPAMLPAGGNITLYAIGDGINQPLGILAFPVGELATRTPVDNSANGWWNILEGSGQGFILQPMPSQNRLVGTWYTYDEAGNPLFLTFDSCQEDVGDNGFECSTPGAFDGLTAETALFLSTGGGPQDGQEVLTERIGTIDFEIGGCNDATARVTLDGEAPEIYTGKRLTQPLPCTLVQ
ncbi:DUF4397 domain-containing protein [Elongatibacter sediminis]|uniref:DUF4397 domain-containing protein n=1 Tax=Elongatibacter sediminis TaxID=3119006 RepID=A0AAW9RED3_9GAMM